jgi:hypothetical protein
MGDIEIMLNYNWDVTDEELATIAGNFKDFAPAKITTDGQELYVYQNLTKVPMTDSNKKFLAPVSDDPFLASLQTFVWASDRITMYMEQPIDSRADNQRKGNTLQFAVETCLKLIKAEKPEVRKATRTEAERIEFMQTKAKQYDALLRSVDFAKSNQPVDDDRSLGSIVWGLDD